MNEAFNTETIEHKGVTVLIEYFYDSDRGAPWKEEDGHGVIRDTRAYYGWPDKKPGEIIIHQDRGDYWLYDIQATTEIAKRDGWGVAAVDAAGLTKGQITALAVKRDMEFCRGYLRDDWHYAGIVCTVLDKHGEKTDDEDSCCGFETFDDYHETAGLEMAQGLAESVAKRKRQEFTQRMREARERKYWASRDVATVGA